MSVLPEKAQTRVLAVCLTDLSSISSSRHPQAAEECVSRTPDPQGEGAGSGLASLAAMEEVWRGVGQDGQGECRPTWCQGPGVFDLTWVNRVVTEPSVGKLGVHLLRIEICQKSPFSVDLS